MNEYRDIHASILRFVNQFAVDQTGLGKPLSAVNLDAFANPTTWPSQDFIGISEFRMDMSVPPVVQLALVISTKDDKNLFRMEGFINSLLNKLSAPNMAILIVDALAGTPRGRLNLLEQTRVETVIHTESQPAKPVFVTLKSDRPLLP